MFSRVPLPRSESPARSTEETCVLITFVFSDYRAAQPRVTKWERPWVLNAFSWVFL